MSVFDGLKPEQLISVTDKENQRVKAMFKEFSELSRDVL